MDFPRTKPKVLGYDPEQVDVLLQRLQRQYENPELKLVTSAVVNVAKFDLVPGGYQIPVVDTAIAKLAEIFLEREIAGLVRTSRAQVALELSNNLREIKAVLEAGPKKSFSSQNQGFKKRDVAALLRRIEIKRGALNAPDSLELRTIGFRRSRSGLDRLEVDAFLNLVIRTLHCQKALG
jgi:DivIVA domain-containing protein